jgi:FkbM family methyltransferase
MLALVHAGESGAPRALWREVKRALRPISPQWLLNWRETRFYAAYGEIELHLLDLLCDPLRDSIDVGANDGSFVHFLRRRSKTVHAFEPMPAQVDTLRRKFPSGNVVIYPLALSRQAGSIELHLPVVNGEVVTGCATVSTEAAAAYPGHRSMAVRMDRLDNVYRGNAGFIKIDVEGHQQAVLDGAMETFRRCRPRALVEIIEEMSPGGLAQAQTFFGGLRYAGYFIDQRRLRPIAEFAPDRLQRPEDRPDLVAHPAEERRAYLYNFIFLPCESERDDVRRIRARLDIL